MCLMGLLASLAVYANASTIVMCRGTTNPEYDPEHDKPDIAATWNIGTEDKRVSVSIVYGDKAGGDFSLPNLSDGYSKRDKAHGIDKNKSLPVIFTSKDSGQYSFAVEFVKGDFVKGTIGSYALSDYSVILHEDKEGALGSELWRIRNEYTDFVSSKKFGKPPSFHDFMSAYYITGTLSKDPIPLSCAYHNSQV
jgi:hypothetical protein